MDMFADISEQDCTVNENDSQAKLEKHTRGHGDDSAAIVLFDDLPGERNEGRQMTADNSVGTSLADSHTSQKRKLEDENHTEQECKKTAKGCTFLKGYVAKRKGEREEMQDAHVMINNMTPDFHNLSSTISNIAYYAVFDGHGGARASTSAAENLHHILISKFPKGEVINRDREIKKCFIETFKKTDEQFLKEATLSKPAWKDGSTAVCLLAVDDVLYIANLGDSKAFLCRYNEDSKKEIAIPLTKDHTPTQYEERQRIQKAGGTVREGRVMGILEVSRSIGDGRFKHCGITCQPDIKRCQLTNNDRFILVACDGLWKAFKSDEAIQFIRDITQGDSLKIEDTDSKSSMDIKYDTACARLASEAVRRGSADNVTVMLIHIQK
ncbi:integrin-linked kinase-associated serine/threonine phosphatase 2C-like [Glandiceps talaboti]